MRVVLDTNILAYAEGVGDEACCRGGLYPDHGIDSPGCCTAKLRPWENCPES